MSTPARDLLRNNVKEKLARNEVVASMTVRLVRGIEIARIARTAGFDTFYVDIEHCSFSLETTSQLCLAGLAAGITPMVRVPNGNPEYVARVLEGGALGVIVPHVRCAAEAQRVVAAAKFAPAGDRSLGGARSSALRGRDWCGQSPYGHDHKLSDHSDHPLASRLRVGVWELGALSDSAPARRGISRFRIRRCACLGWRGPMMGEVLRACPATAADHELDWQTVAYLCSHVMGGAHFLAVKPVTIHAPSGRERLTAAYVARMA
jgi:hypothetical protein